MKFQRGKALLHYFEPSIFIIRVLKFGLLLLIGLELFFWFGLHASEYPRGVQDPATGISYADTSWVREGFGSFGPYCKAMGHWVLNNEGWNSIFDYTEREDYTRPRIAILGNSYIEGWAADVESHVDAELFRLLGGEADVYAFGLSGATFAQFLGMLPYIENKFDPDIYLIMASSFGIQRSLDATVSPYRFYIEEKDSVYSLCLPQAVFRQNRLGRIVFRSALARYLLLNKQVFSEALNIDAGDMVVAAGDLSDEIPVECIRAGEFFLESFRDCLPGDKIVFFADGNPMDFLILDGLVINDSMFTLVDLAGYMAEDFEENGIRFSRDYDPHWNNYAHETAARALLPYVREAITELGY